MGAMDGPIFKLRSTLEGGHIVVRVFVAPSRGMTFECAGDLRFRAPREIGQWQVFGAALALGIDRMRSVGFGPSIVLEGGDEVVAELSDREKS